MTRHLTEWHNMPQCDAITRSEVRQGMTKLVMPFRIASFEAMMGSGPMSTPLPSSSANHSTRKVGRSTTGETKDQAKKYFKWNIKPLKGNRLQKTTDWGIGDGEGEGDGRRHSADMLLTLTNSLLPPLVTMNQLLSSFVTPVLHASKARMFASVETHCDNWVHWKRCLCLK